MTEGYVSWSTPDIFSMLILNQVFVFQWRESEHSQGRKSHWIK